MNSYNSINSPSLRSLAEILFKRKNLILIVFTVIFVGSFSVFLLPSRFQSEAKILIERESATEKELLFRTNLSGRSSDEEWINSEIEIIKSKPVAKMALISAGLLDTSNVKVTTADINKDIKIFLKEVRVEKPRNSNVLDISFEAKDSEKARQVVNALIHAYIAYRAEINDDSESYHFFSDQVRIADSNLREMENRLSEFKQNQGIISPDAQRQILIARLADFGKTLTDLQTQRLTREMRLAVLKRQSELGLDDLIPSVESSDITGRDKYIAKLKSDLMDMGLSRDKLLQQYTPDYEEIVNLNGQMVATKQMISKEIRQVIESEKMVIQSLLSEERLLENAIEKTNQEIKEFAQKEYQFSQYSRGIDDNRDIYSMLLKQMAESRISLAKMKKGINIKVINPAQVQHDPVKPKKKLLVLIGFFLGMILALSAAIGAEYFDQTINDAEELEKILGFAGLGTVRELKFQSVNKSNGDQFPHSVKSN
jgi:uncharacterized protein involved in exopolysaccharide biosynthesis